MIISKTPFRISFFGGGTDLPEYFFRQNKGAVISTAIDKYIYLTVSSHPKEINEESIKIAYSKIENLENVDEMQHTPFKEIIKYFNISKNIEIHVISDLPSFSGLGGSSSFTVGLVNALSTFVSEPIDNHQLTYKSIDIERNILKEAVGCQDQTIAAFGGMNFIEFNSESDIKVTPIDLNPNLKDELSNSLMLFFTGIKRKAQTIEINKINNIKNIYNELDNIHKITLDALNMLTNSQSISRFGDLLSQTWELKKKLSKDVSASKIDQMYNDAIDAGAIGGKLLGAGGGGFLLLVVPNEKKGNVRNSLREFYEINFNIMAEGSKIIHNNN
tara:strand:- start:1536 stop:2525 length:990 start_codon:yes stop_codon:yes gene_type:complete